MKERNQLTLLYDERCRLCQRTVRTLSGIRTSAVLNMVPLQKADPAQLPVRLEKEQLLGELHVFDGSGQVFAGSEAVFRILREVPRLRWLALLQRIPGMRGISRRMYAWIAGNRYRLFGEADAEEACESGVCSLHNISGNRESPERKST